MGVPGRFAAGLSKARGATIGPDTLSKSMRSGALRRMDRPTEYSEVQAALSNVAGAQFTMDGVRGFLRKLDLDKDNSTRLVCWLASFGILSPRHDRWVDELYGLYQRYGELIDLRIADAARPLDQAPQASIIAGDVSRSMSWFAGMAADLRLAPALTGDAELRATRVLSAQALGVAGFSYCQGYDRYVLVSHALALAFCGANGLGPGFAEAVTFALSDRLVETAQVRRYLDDVSSTAAHYARMDRVLAKVAPDTMRLLQDMQQGSIHFALRWELLLFADEHGLRGLTLLWDQILCAGDQCAEFLFGLCVAHAVQVPLAGPGEMMIEKIQTFRDWDVPRIIVGAPAFVGAGREHPLGRVGVKGVLVGLLALMLVAVLALNMRRV